jgi:Protein of unknown function (DUF3800)
MHPPKDLKRRTLAATHYVDDSGSEETAKLAVTGGPVFPDTSAFSFHYEWDRILSLHKVNPPIHMKEFTHPKGVLAYLDTAARRSLFFDLVWLINREKVYSLTTAVDNLEFQEFFPVPKFRGLMRSAPLGVLWCMILNHINVENHDRMARMGYVIDESHLNPQIRDCHSFWASYEARTESTHTGSLTFAKSSTKNALQAADMVAWANRRKHLGQPFENGFEPLELLTRYVDSAVKPIIHFHFRVGRESTRKLASILGDPVRGKGKRTSLLGVVPPEVVLNLPTT